MSKCCISPKRNFKKPLEIRFFLMKKVNFQFSVPKFFNWFLPLTVLLSDEVSPSRSLDLRDLFVPVANLVLHWKVDKSGLLYFRAKSKKLIMFLKNGAKNQKTWIIWGLKRGNGYLKVSGLVSSFRQVLKTFLKSNYLCLRLELGRLGTLDRRTREVFMNSHMKVKKKIGEKTILWGNGEFGELNVWGWSWFWKILWEYRRKKDWD